MRLQPQLIPAADHYWSTLVRNDVEAAIGVVGRVIDAGVHPAEALAGIVVHNQQRIGDSWAAGHWTVGQEHTATAVSEQVVSWVGESLPAPDPDRPRVLVICAEREFHSLAAQVVAVSLRSWGWPADYLGPDTRRERLLRRLGAAPPAAVLVSASLSSSLTRVARQIADVAATGTPVIVGGAAFDEGGLRAGRLGASGYGASPEEARTLLGRLPDIVIPQPVTLAAEAVRLAALSDTMARWVLEATESQLHVEPQALNPDHWQVVLATFTPHLVAAVAGGVATADPTVPTAARTWLDDVLRRRGAPDDVTDLLWKQLRDQLHDFPASLALLD
ncbi:cobalamin B12-binding domain-containing protein [Nocardioides sp. GXQ0305]|uniref:cobalamin B12-binding domain-containing protein n=1 Tax=Nocardioides sp. GXQ0305 TaxID=3423912 RepID=UPI003D7C50C2